MKEVRVTLKEDIETLEKKITQVKDKSGQIKLYGEKINSLLWPHNKQKYSAKT